MHRARPSGPENLPILGTVVDSNPYNFLPTVTGVVKGGPGERAGLRVGYLITVVNHSEVHSVRELVEKLAALPADASSVTLGFNFPSNLGYMPKEAEVRLKP